MEEVVEDASKAMPPSFALAIPHAPWRPERVESLSRLLRDLGFDHPKPSPEGLVSHRVFSDREPNWSWSEKIWRWGYDCLNTTHLLQLQDDVQVGPAFWPHLSKLVRAVPDQIIGLESVHPVSTLLYNSSGSSWYTTTDGLIGVAYVIPRALLGSLLDWRQNSLRADAAKRLNEDQLVGIFSASTSRHIWHPVPTIVDHDTDLPSTYGNDRHSHRRPPVTTVRGAKPPKDNWQRAENAVHTGAFYGVTARLCRRFVKTVSYFDMWRIASAK